MPDNTNMTTGQNYQNNPNLPQVPPEYQGKNLQVQGQMEKPTLKRRIQNFLMSDKLDSMGNYLFYCILGPSIKNLLWQLGSGALSMTLFGGGQGAAPNMNGNYVPGYGYQPARRDPYPYQNQYQYNPYPGYQQPSYGYAQPQPGPFNPNQQPGINDISFNTKDDAWLVLDRMGRELARYGKVRVADFYNFSGFTPPENNWAIHGTGWTSLATAQPTMRTDGRWVIQFPPVQMI